MVINLIFHTKNKENFVLTAKEFSFMLLALTDV